MLLEPRDREACVGVEVSLLLRKDLVKRLVDQAERGAHCHRSPVSLQHLRVPREDRHAGSDRRLCEIDGRNVAMLELPQSFRQLGAQRIHELATSCDRSRRARGRQTRRIEDASALAWLLQDELE